VKKIEVMECERIPTVELFDLKSPEEADSPPRSPTFIPIADQLLLSKLIAGFVPKTSIE